MNHFGEVTMNRLVILRPLASAVVLAVAAMGVAPAFAALPQASSLSRVSRQALSMQPVLGGTLVALHHAQTAVTLTRAGAEATGTATVLAPPPPPAPPQGSPAPHRRGAKGGRGATPPAPPRGSPAPHRRGAKGGRGATPPAPPQGGPAPHRRGAKGGRGATPPAPPQGGRAA
jgi:hypothetical protein